jgi:hypothetical protein
MHIAGSTSTNVNQRIMYIAPLAQSREVGCLRRDAVAGAMQYACAYVAQGDA